MESLLKLNAKQAHGSITTRLSYACHTIFCSGMRKQGLRLIKASGANPLRNCTAQMTSKMILDGTLRVVGLAL
jgi:hypothetical protein